MNIDRFEAELLLMTLCRLTNPTIGDTLIFTEDGWAFRRPISLLEEDPSEPVEGTIWFNVADSTIRVRVGGVTLTTPALTPV